MSKFCHGGKQPADKGPRDGCAALWRVWGAVGYFIEQFNLIKNYGKHPPAEWTDEDWRLGVQVWEEYLEQSRQQGRKEGGKK